MREPSTSLPVQNVDPVLFAVGTHFHPRLSHNRYHQEILTIQPGANRANTGTGFKSCLRNLLSRKK